MTTSCKKQPSFNYDGQSKGMFCSEHKRDGMVDVKNSRCQYEDCKTTPIFSRVKLNTIRRAVA